MKFIILGSGARENAIISKLVENSYNKVYCFSNYINPQIEKIVNEYIVIPILYNNNNILREINNIYIENDEIIVIPGSETFLAIGIVDFLMKYNILCIGPLKISAMIETSKCFCRHHLTYNNLQEFQPKYEVIYEFNKDRLLDIFKSYNYSFVIKADSLCGGKGVRVYDLENHMDSLDYIQGLVNNTLNFETTNKCILEERLCGPEFSLLSFCDGKNIKHMPLVQDYKDLGDYNTIKTGGMGSIILPSHTFPFLTDEELLKCQDLNRKVMLNLSEDTEYGYRGILYGGYMKTEKGVKLIEFNARFGDPECVNLLSLLETPLTNILKSIIRQDLDKLEIKFRKEYSLCRYLVPPGYPNYVNGTNPSNVSINIINNNNNNNNNNILLAGITQGSSTDNFKLTRSRSIALISCHSRLEKCIEEIEKLTSTIQGPVIYRKDIGSNYLTKNSYEQSGVNIIEGEQVVKKIQSAVESTYDENVVSQYGDFGGLYDISKKIISGGFQNPVLVASTDGVGTKTKLVLDVLGEEMGLKSLGQDIVNHSVNDIIVKGAEPLFFLDYVASGKINSDNIKYLVEGIAEACCQNGVSLLGGETAEMPGVYKEGCYDIVGTIIGMCSQNKIINGPKDIMTGDIVFGLRSSGPHTNGYSLIRKILKEEMENHNNSTELKINGVSITEFIKPHKSYLKELTNFQNIDIDIKIKGLCHITGGGYYGNLPRVIGNDLGLELKVPILEPFATLQQIGNLSDREMYDTFNCGYGMLVFIDEKYKETVLKETYCHYLGKVVTRDGELEQINLV